MGIKRDSSQSDALKTAAGRKTRNQKLQSEHYINIVDSLQQVQKRILDPEIQRIISYVLSEVKKL